MSERPRIAITGTSGFIGGCALRYLKDLRGEKAVIVNAVPREAFESPVELADSIRSANAIFHFAGTNRGDDATLYETNVRVAQHIVDACRAANMQPHILFASSIYAGPFIEGLIDPGRPSAFGEAKREAARLFEEWAKESGGKVTTFFIPHVFGVGAEPFKNSAVATLCYQLARGEGSQLREGAVVELVPVDDVVERFYRACQMGETGTLRIEGERMELVRVYEILKSWTEAYRSDAGVEPKGRLQERLHETLLAFIKEQ